LGNSNQMEQFFLCDLFHILILDICKESSDLIIRKRNGWAQTTAGPKLFSKLSFRMTFLGLKIVITLGKSFNLFVEKLRNINKVNAFVYEFAHKSQKLKHSEISDQLLNYR